MPRKARIDAPGALHHIMLRGIERKIIFRDQTDRVSFLDRFGAILLETATACYAWVLMSNHVHLLLRTGTIPIATVMRRLLTGYAVTYNRRHRRHGQLFQNRYKSILCQEDPYFLELVRYIHLNPLRARNVEVFKNLDAYPYAGHSVILGKRRNNWQDADYVLAHFDDTVTAARRHYRAYVQDGIREGKRPDLVGGGLIRSLGGWMQVRTSRKEGIRLKGDERILGDSGFVTEVLKASEERLDFRSQLRAKGYDLDMVARKAASLFGLELDDLFVPGKYPPVVQARSLFCYWAVRELGVNGSDLARDLKLSQPAVSISVRRGERIARDNGFELVDE
ncbi:MAG: transposase [Deltaproteobacteria bacterium]|nr:MAG: transposase [Deltaproteobacteria bacterium]